MNANPIALVLIIGLSCTAAWWFSHDSAAPGVPNTTTATSYIDFSGVSVAQGDYQRIACCSTIAALVVPELVNPNRVIMVPSWHTKQSTLAYRTDHAVVVGSANDVEVILRAHPDLVIVNSISLKPERIARLRDAGLPVLNLGDMKGWDTLVPNIAALGTVLKREQQAAALIARLRRQLHHAAVHVPIEERKTALWLANHGGRLFGGTKGSSYHDLLRFGGLIDVAAGQAASPWPQWEVEQVLLLDPEVLVTNEGGAAELRSIPGFQRLRAVQNDAIIEMPRRFDSTGIQLPLAAEFLCDQVYGPAPQLLPDQQQNSDP